MNTVFRVKRGALGGFIYWKSNAGGYTDDIAEAGLYAPGGCVPEHSYDVEAGPLIEADIVKTSERAKKLIAACCEVYGVASPVVTPADGWTAEPVSFSGTNDIGDLHYVGVRVPSQMLGGERGHVKHILEPAFALATANNIRRVVVTMLAAMAMPPKDPT